MDMPPQVSAKIERFFQDFPLRRYARGQLLMLAGDNPKQIFYLVSGIIRVYDISDKGNEVVVGVFKPTTVFPLSWMILEKPNIYFFEARTNVVVREAPASRTLNFIKKNSDVTFNMLVDICLNMETMRRRIAHFMGGTAKSRLIFELIIATQSFGVVQPDGSYLIEVSEGEIGARSGLSRETVSREIHDLKKLDLINANHQGIQLTNLNALEAKLGFSL
jgi:CRP/FNR family cyclic AMP-dependent transcriptional regulator